MLTHFTNRAPDRHGIAVCTKQPRTLRVFEAADRPESPVPLGIQRRFWGSDRAVRDIDGGDWVQTLTPVQQENQNFGTQLAS